MEKVTPIRTEGWTVTAEVKVGLSEPLTNTAVLFRVWWNGQAGGPIHCTSPYCEGRAMCPHIETLFSYLAKKARDVT